MGGGGDGRQNNKKKGATCEPLGNRRDPLRLVVISASGLRCIIIILPTVYILI